MVFQPVTGQYNIQKVLGQSPPVAVATVQQNKLEITLNGSASYSPEGSPISFYNWSQIDANQPVSLASNGSLATFMAPNITGPHPVNYSFSLVVTDSNGLVSAPSVVNVTVNNVNSSNFSALPLSPVELPPHAIGTYPANGSTNIPIKDDKFTATFDQDIEVNPTNTTLKDVAGNEIPIEVTTEGPTVTIMPKSDLVPGTNYTIFLNELSGKGKTNLGSAFYTFTTAAETPIIPAEFPPHAIGTYPANGSTNIPIKDDKFTATFDQDIEVNPTNTTLKDVAGNEIPIEVTTEGPTVTIMPKSDLVPGTNYTIFLNELSGKGKTNLGSAFYTFTTAAEAVPPTQPPTTPTPPTTNQTTTTTTTTTTTPSLPTNHPPQALNQQVTTEADKPIQIALGATDNDTGDSLSASIVTKPQPDHGSLGNIDQNTGNVTYTPAPGFIGNDSFTFKVTDSHQAESNVATVSISIKPSPNKAPVIELIHSSVTSAKAGSQVKLQVLDKDLKDENLTSLSLNWKQISGQPPVNLILSSDNRTASFTAPELKQSAALGFRLTATDEKNQSATKDITINIQAAPPNMPPKVSAGSNQNVASGDSVKLIGTVTDEGTPKLTWIQTEGPSTDISLKNSNQKEASFIAPPVKSTTKLGFNFTAIDDKNQKASSIVTVTVNPISLENDKDSDNDGIFNNVDKDITKPSTEFLDKLDQSPPQTFGKIVVQPGVTNAKVTVKDAANEQNGVVISVSPDAPGTVTVLACGSSSTVLGKGDTILLTCGSADIKVIQGDAFTKLNTSDGSVIQGTLTEGNLIIFDPAKRTLQADSGNAGVVDLSVTGNKKLNEVVLNAGKIVTLPPSGNAPTKTTTPPKPTTTPPKPTTTPPKPTTTPPKPTTTPPKPTTTPPKPTTTPPKPPLGGPAGAAPTVSIQPVLPVREGATFVLDGSLSKGALPTETLTFLWQQISGPTAKAVFGQNTAKATYQAPVAINQTNVPMIFKLTAKNAKGVEGTSQISVSLVKGIANARPIANAGIDRMVRENANVILDGSKSTGPNGVRLSYQWIQTFGNPKVILNGSDTSQPSFKAPIVPLNNSVLLFRLTVKDPAGLNSSDIVRVTVLKAGIPDRPPIANAGPDVAAIAGSNVTLFGNKSSDPDPKDVLAYSWKQIGGSPSVTLNSENLQTAWFKAPDLPTNATLTFALTVTDKQRKNNTDYVSVTVFKPQGFPLWLMIGIVAAAAAAGLAAWLLLFKKKPKPRTKFVP